MPNTAWVLIVEFRFFFLCFSRLIRSQNGVHPLGSFRERVECVMQKQNDRWAVKGSPGIARGPEQISLCFSHDRLVFIIFYLSYRLKVFFSSYTKGTIRKNMRLRVIACIYILFAAAIFTYKLASRPAILIFYFASYLRRFRRYILRKEYDLFFTLFIIINIFFFLEIFQRKKKYRVKQF